MLIVMAAFQVDDIVSSGDDELFQNMESNRRKRRKIRRRTDNLEEWDEQEFLDRFRMSKKSVRELEVKIRSDIQLNTERNDALTPMARLLLTLRFYATATMLIAVGDFCGVHKSTPCRVIKSVTRAIAGLRPQYVKISDDVLTIQKFHQIARFPKVVSAIDCTHVKIQSPGGDMPEIFRNRKGYFSVNVQVVGTAELKISHIVARWPGSTHDQTIFNNSTLKFDFEAGKYQYSILLGDSGYALKHYLLTPIRNPSNPAEHLYNESHIRTRNAVERLFGMWKRRFPVLSLGIRLQLDTALAVIVACSVLHNIAIENKDPEPLERNIGPIDVDPLLQPNIDVENRDHRQPYVEYFRRMQRLQ